MLGGGSHQEDLGSAGGLGEGEAVLQHRPTGQGMDEFRVFGIKPIALAGGEENSG
jgi:hypothetical protein